MKYKNQETLEYRVDQQMREQKRYEDGEITFAEYQRRIREIATLTPIPPLTNNDL